MKTGSFVSAEEVLAEATTMCGDRSYRKGLSQGWYKARLRDAVQNMAIDTYYFKVTVDKKIPKNLRVELPDNMMNLGEIYVYNTGPDGCCTPAGFIPVMWKRTFNNHNNPDEGSAKIMNHNTGSGFIPRQRSLSSGRVDLFASEENNLILLDPRIKPLYTHVRLVGNGFGSNPETLPPVPRIIKSYAVSYIVERYYAAKTAENWREYRHIWHDWQGILERDETKARSRINKSSRFIRESFRELQTSIHQK